MWGWIFQEWKGSSKKAHSLIAAGIITLILSAIIIGYGTMAERLGRWPLKLLRVNLVFSLAAAIIGGTAFAGPTPVAEKSPLTSFVIQPKRVVWKVGPGVANSENLLKPHSGQAVLIEPVPPLVLKPGAGHRASTSAWKSPARSSFSRP